MGGAAKAAFIALQNPRSGFSQLGIGGIILAAGLGAVQGLAKAETSIRAENKEARLEKAQFGANKALLMLEIQKVVSVLHREGLTNETRIAVANLNAKAVAIEATLRAADRQDTAEHRAALLALANLRQQTQELMQKQGADRLQLQRDSAVGAAGQLTREQTGAPPPGEGGSASEFFAQKLAGMVIDGNISELIPKSILKSAAETATAAVVQLGQQTGKQGAEQFNTQYNIALVALFRNKPDLLKAIFAGQ